MAAQRATVLVTVWALALLAVVAGAGTSSGPTIAAGLLTLVLTPALAVLLFAVAVLTGRTRRH